MENFLRILGFHDKEIIVYLGLLEMGKSPASVLAKKINLPKSTTLFHAENLATAGLIYKSIKVKTAYFYADPDLLAKTQRQIFEDKSEALKAVLPLLEAQKSADSARPKVEFFEGIESCKTCYLDLLNSQTEILEFGSHGDLVEKWGADFMDHFIAERTRRKIFLKAIVPMNPIDGALKPLDKISYRDIKTVSNEFGKLFSSITIYEDKVLIINLFHGAFAIRIKNQEFSASMKMIFNLLRSLG